MAKCGVPSKLFELGVLACVSAERMYDVDTEAVSRHHALIPQSLLGTLPAMVRTELAQLSASRQEEFLEEYRRRKKSVGVAYLLWFVVGLQYGYLGRWGLQVVYWITAGGVGIWALVLLFFIPSLVRNYNKDVSIEVLRHLQAISAPPAH